MFRAFSRLLRRSDAVAPPGTQTPAATLSTKLATPAAATPGWRSSPAHLLLLSRYLHGQTPAYAETDLWREALAEPPQKAVGRFVQDGVLEEADLHTRLAYKCKLPDLKAMLRERSLPVSGKKDDLIDRLIAADLPGMNQVVSGERILQCTVAGQEIAERYLAGERQKRAAAEQAVLVALTERRLRDASLLVSRFEAGQVFARGMGIDWAHHDPAHDVAVLAYIFNARPKILAKVSEEHLNRLRLAGAMIHLWGTSRVVASVPLDFETGLIMDNESAARMCFFYAAQKVGQESWSEIGVTHATISGAQDGQGCPECARIRGKRYRVDRLPEIPYEKCTCELGCRCSALPEINW